MVYHDFERLVSTPRMVKYLRACGNNTRKAMALYRANMRFSTEMFSILCLFEVALRNAIDIHYRGRLGNNWLFGAAHPGGFLHAIGCEKSLEGVKKGIANLGGSYTPDKVVAELTISTVYATQKYNQVQEVLQWLGINVQSFLFGVDGFQREKQYIDNLALVPNRTPLVS